jgi:hypothetical protein
MNLPKFVKKTLFFIVTCDPCVSIDGFDYVVYNEKHPALFFFTRRSKTNGSLLLLFCWSSFCLLFVLAGSCCCKRSMAVFCYCFAGRHSACYLFWLEAAVVKEAWQSSVIVLLVVILPVTVFVLAGSCCCKRSTQCCSCSCSRLA